MADEIVGHKTFSTGDPMHPFRHEPLRQSEADAMWAAVEAARTKRAEDMPTDQDAVNVLGQARERLRELGWREECYAPDGIEAQIIELGSSGIHQGRKDGTCWWIAEAGDLWPSHPILFKPLAPPERTATKEER